MKSSITTGRAPSGQMTMSGATSRGATAGAGRHRREDLVEVLRLPLVLLVDVGLHHAQTGRVLA
jgi:hypothetical protein